MTTLFLILIVLDCVLLGLIVLVQNPKGGGLASGFTGAQQIGGVRKTTDFLEKATWTLAIALVVLCLAATISQGKTTVQESPTQEWTDQYREVANPTQATQNTQQQQK